MATELLTNGQKVVIVEKQQKTTKNEKNIKDVENKFNQHFRQTHMLFDRRATTFHKKLKLYSFHFVFN